MTSNVSKCMCVRTTLHKIHTNTHVITLNKQKTANQSYHCYICIMNFNESLVGLKELEQITCEDLQFLDALFTDQQNILQTQFFFPSV